jgi:hypothetical protein
MQYYRILTFSLFALFICVISQRAFSHETTFNNSYKPYNAEGLSQDSIPKSEIAEYRKRFESVEKMIATKRGNYADAKNSFNSISSSRVRNLPEFAGRYSAMQQKLNAWNLEVNPKTPPVVVPNNPSTPRNTGKTNEPVEKVTGNITEHKSLMLTYFPDTLSVGNEFLAYVEITKDNTVKFGNLNAGNNTTLDSIIITSLAGTPGVTPGTQVSVELSRDGGADNFAITSRSDKTKTLSDNGTSRWEWNLRPNAEGDTRLRLNVTYKKVSADGKTTQDVQAINKFIVVKGLAKQTVTVEKESNYLPWIITGAIVLLVLIGYALSRGKKNNYERRKAEQDRLDRERIEQSRNEQKRINSDRDDLNR